MSSAPNWIMELINRLDKNNTYGLMCHSSKVNEVKQWDLPYKIMSNEWWDMALSDKEKVYIIPIEDKPIKYCRERGELNMNKEEALEYCYKHEKEYKSDLYACGEDGDEMFACLITILESGTITPDQLKDYGMDY